MDPALLPMSLSYGKFVRAVHSVELTRKRADASWDNRFVGDLHMGFDVTSADVSDRFRCPGTWGLTRFFFCWPVELKSSTGGLSLEGLALVG